MCLCSRQLLAVPTLVRSPLSLLPACVIGHKFLAPKLLTPTPRQPHSTAEPSHASSHTYMGMKHGCCFCWLKSIVPLYAGRSGDGGLTPPPPLSIGQSRPTYGPSLAPSPMESAGQMHYSPPPSSTPLARSFVHSIKSIVQAGIVYLHAICLTGLSLSRAASTPTGGPNTDFKPPEAVSFPDVPSPFQPPS